MIGLVLCAVSVACNFLKTITTDKLYQRIDLYVNLHTSTVARGEGSYSPPHLVVMSTKMQNEKNTTFLALLRLFYALEWTK